MLLFGYIRCVAFIHVLLSSSGVCPRICVNTRTGSLFFLANRDSPPPQGEVVPRSTFQGPDRPSCPLPGPWSKSTARTSQPPWVGGLKTFTCFQFSFPCVFEGHLCQKLKYESISQFPDEFGRLGPRVCGHKARGFQFFLHENYSEMLSSEMEWRLISREPIGNGVCFGGGVTWKFR